MKSTKCTISRIYFFNKVLRDFPGINKKIQGFSRGFQVFKNFPGFSRIPSACTSPVGRWFFAHFSLFPHGSTFDAKSEEKYKILSVFRVMDHSKINWICWTHQSGVSAGVHVVSICHVLNVSQSVQLACWRIATVLWYLVLERDPIFRHLFLR